MGLLRQGTAGTGNSVRAHLTDFSRRWIVRNVHDELVWRVLSFGLDRHRYLLDTHLGIPLRHLFLQDVHDSVLIERKTSLLL